MAHLLKLVSAMDKKKKIIETLFYNSDYFSLYFTILKKQNKTKRQNCLLNTIVREKSELHVKLTIVIKKSLNSVKLTILKKSQNNKKSKLRKTCNCDKKV